jgi:pimeloyl-ACP methyl ester carboxylesterase
LFGAVALAAVTRWHVILAAGVQVAEHTIELAGTPVCYRSAEPELAPILYLHGAPTSSDDWIGLLQRTGGLAPDLVGFGRSSKAANLDYTLSGLGNFIETVLDHLEVPRVTLVAHDWGAGGGLVFAQRHPERVRRLVLVNALPLLDGFTWHGLARIVRRPVIGELVMGAISRSRLRRTLRRGYADPQALSDARAETIWSQFDQGTQRAVLRLQRSASEEQLVRAGARLEVLTMPGLVVWGDLDPWLPASMADLYGGRLRHAQVVHVPDAGHWPWLERPEVAEQIAAFVEET